MTQKDFEWIEGIKSMERFAISAMTYLGKARDAMSIEKKLSAARLADNASGASEQNIDDSDERGDVPGWVLVVLMTTGLVTAIWTIAAPRLSTILRNSLDAMNGIR
jgi:hypothetical protein